MDLEKLHQENAEGYSLPELSRKYGIPRTTLNRYLRNAGFPVYFNRYQNRIALWKKRQERREFGCQNAWRNALLENRGHKCQLCGYAKIVEAHHLVPQSEGGLRTRENGVLLCPNCHAEDHAGLLEPEQQRKLDQMRPVPRHLCKSDIDRTCDQETRRRIEDG